MIDQRLLNDATSSGYQYGVTRSTELVEKLAREYQENGMWEFAMLTLMIAKLLEAQLRGPQNEERVFIERSAALSYYKHIGKEPPWWMD